MLKRIVVTAVLLVLAGSPMLAQSPKVDVSVYGGYTLSDGVSGQTITAGDGNAYNRVDPKDSGSFGFSVGALLGRGEAGFMYGYQPTKLILGGTADRTIGDQTISTYHGYFAYNFAEPGGRVVPFLYGGLGATNFSNIDVVFAGTSRSIAGETQFSTTWGVGVKFFPSPHVGIRAAMSITPTYIKSDPGGWWCDPFWGCYLVGDPQYSNQFSFSGGASFRF